MQRFERILVCVGRPPRDVHLLGYAGFIARVARSVELHILHVADRGAEDSGDSPEQGPASQCITQDALRLLVSEHIADPVAQISQCTVLHGTPLLEILRYAHDRDVDLVVVGRHDDLGNADRHAAILARRVTRKATCSVLVLPGTCQARAGKLLVPVRDSECSANALDTACGIADATDAEVTALNVYQVHAGYARVGMTLEQCCSELEAAADRESQRLLGRVDTRSVDVRCLARGDTRDDPLPVILQAARDESAELVVIGARGRTGTAGVLLGALTERLIQRSPIPTLAVKKKGECLGVLRALLTLAGEG